MSEKKSEWFTPDQVELLKNDLVKSLVRNAMEYQQAHDYVLSGQLASTDAMLLDLLVDEKEVDKAFNEFISL